VRQGRSRFWSLILNFVPSLPVFLAYTAASLLLAVTPGPDMALFLSKTLGGGRRFGFSALGCCMVGLVIHACAAALGLSALLAASAQAYGAVKLVGAAYLLWLAYGALRHGSVLHLEGGAQGQGSLFATFLTGLGINLTNPKIIIFFVTFLPQFIEAGDVHAGGKFLFLGLYFLCVASLVSGLLIVVASRFVTAAKSRPRLMRVFDYALASLMGAFAARLILAQGR
jgi:threonine/homoserine/homoserine lactone efflux protein